MGGSANFAIDREAAEEFLRVYPGNTAWAQYNRAFLGRAVRELCRLGIHQFLDLGSGVPTVGNVHEIALTHNPHAHIAYVDIEPVAVHHALRMVGDNPQVTVTQADLTEPSSVLHAPGVAEFLDFDRPIAVLAVAILDIIDSADAAGLMGTYRDACPSGSALAITNGAALAMTTEERAGIDTVMAGTTTPHVHFRDPDEIAEIFTGYALLDPGIVPSAAWRPDEPISTEKARHSNGYAAVGLRP